MFILKTRHFSLGSTLKVKFKNQKSKFGISLIISKTLMRTTILRMSTKRRRPRRRVRSPRSHSVDVSPRPAACSGSWRERSSKSRSDSKKKTKNWLRWACR